MMDTARNRQSALFPLLPFARTVPPDAENDQGDRQALVGVYAGILVGALTRKTIRLAVDMQRRVTLPVGLEDAATLPVTLQRWVTLPVGLEVT